MEAALWAALSPLGQRVRQPAAFLPLQSAQARGKRFNATIGQITDGRGKAVPLPTMEAVLADLDDVARSQAFLYSPVEGLADLRRAWHERRPPEAPPTALPLVTVGAAQARAILGDLFAGEGRLVVLREPVRPSDRDLFQIRLGADVRTSFEGLPEGEPVLAVDRYREELLQAAGRGPVVAIVDELFWNLIGAHENLVPIRVEEIEGKEVGFLTFPFPPDSAVADAMEKKVKMLLRAQIGSPPAITQVLARRELP
ncbi:MAG TPA: hypothetical protein VNM67_15710 [Thermoanaerobaculia bacterium]|jgi:hypothetical protein|nr:hypothetical protein [Thermoanaerobaculia bacterium]